MGSQGGCLSPSGCYPGEGSYHLNLTPGYAPSGSPAARAGARWMMTENGERAGRQRDAAVRFGGVDGRVGTQQSISSSILARASTVFAYDTNDLENGYPARQFWFDAYNDEHCGAPGQAPQWTWNSQKGDFGGCAPGFEAMSVPGAGLYNVGAGTQVANVFEPRASFTYTIDPDTVIRGSAGKYARAEGSSYYQYNTYQQNLASFISSFIRTGTTRPTTTSIRIRRTTSTFHSRSTCAARSSRIR